MDWTKTNRTLKIVLTATVMLILTACVPRYTFNGASIDYTKTRTITIADFPIRSTYVWGPMAGIFNNRLKEVFANNTRLQQVKRNGDMVIEGEITRYEQRNKAVTSEGYSAQTELTLTVNVRFTNKAKHDEDFERQFSASSTPHSRSTACKKDSSPRWSETSSTRFSMPPWPIGNTQ